MNVYRTSTFWITLLVGQVLAWLLASIVATLTTLGMQAITRSEYSSGRLLNAVGFTVHACLAVLAFFIARSLARRRLQQQRGFDITPPP